MMEKLLVFILGSIVGSFLNVCIWRLPKGRSIISPRSHCPACNAIIFWYDNVPLVSYILLRGRCRRCKSKIPFRYFLVEFLTASLVVVLFVAFGLTAKFFIYSILVSGLIIATFTDLETQEIPDQVTLGGLALGLGMSLGFPGTLGGSSRLSSFIDSSIGALAGAAILYLIGFIWERVRKKEAMGGGDIKLLAMIGSFLGWKLTMLTFFIAPFFGIIPGIVLMIKDRQRTIPYGPYLSLGALVSILWGEKILKFFLFGLY